VRYLYKTESYSMPARLIFIPLKETIIFPYVVAPLFVQSDDVLNLLNKVVLENSLVGCVGQRDPNLKDPKPKDLLSVGTVCKILQLVKLPNKGMKIFVEGLSRVFLHNITQEAHFFKADIKEVSEPQERTILSETLVQSIGMLFKISLSMGRPLPEEVLRTLDKIDHPGRLADLIAITLRLGIKEQQEIYETIDPMDRLKKVYDHLSREVQSFSVRPHPLVHSGKETGKFQKEHAFRPSVRGGREMAEEDPGLAEIYELREKVRNAGMPQKVEEIANKEINRLERMNPISAEYTVSRTYLDYLVTMPWNKRSMDNLDLHRARAVLDEDHYDLEKVKDRILEFLAVKKLKDPMKGPILCFVGPPGVGKTSVARSIARAMGRKFTRVSLGGIRDEAEVRGHRRTYVGSLPGRIIQSIHKVEVNNPVFLLDEVDKMGMDFRGDPSAALLEVLDPEMNKEFSDHYLEISFDLSDVFFITTANTREPIPKPLQDRMEIIEMSGYTEEEKLGIAKGYLIPRELEKHGLKKNQVEFEEAALLGLIREYTKEAGVRNLEREIAGILRKIATKVVKEEAEKKTIVQKGDLAEYLGAPKYRFGLAEEKDQIGAATGLVWTEVGGDTTPVEVTVMPGRGNLTLTGMMGDVMQESAKAAMSFVRSRAKELGLEENFYRRIDVHIHVPEGAVPKDGPSAGITIATALTSALAKIPVRRDMAMTGEITLRGRILPVGGLKEKILAARRAGIKNVMIPKENKKDLEEFKKEIPSDIKIIFVKEMDEVLKLALAEEIKEKAKEKKPLRYLPGPEPPPMYA